MPIEPLSLGVVPAVELTRAKIDENACDERMAIAVELLVHHQHAAIQRIREDLVETGRLELLDALT